MPNITNSLPKRKDKKLVNFKVDEDKHKAFQNKLRLQKVKMVDFFNTVIDSYLNEK